MHQKLYNKALSKIEATMVLYNENQRLHLESAALGVGLEASLLKVRERMWFPRNEAYNNVTLQSVAFTSKGPMNAESCYSKIEIEDLGMLFGLEEFHLYFFTHEVSIITDHKPLVAIFKNICKPITLAIKIAAVNTWQ